jgi:hypothetical protein
MELISCLVCADDINLLGDNIKKIQNLMDASKEIGLEVNVERTTYIFMSHHQNGGRKS